MKMHTILFPVRALLDSEGYALRMDAPDPSEFFKLTAEEMNKKLNDYVFVSIPGPYHFTQKWFLAPARVMFDPSTDHSCFVELSDIEQAYGKTASEIKQLFPY